MFQQLKNIDTAFKHVRLFTLIIIITLTVISAISLVKGFQVAEEANQRIYILANGKILEAIATTRRENIGVEAKDHVETFHRYFYNLDPDDEVIQMNLKKALYLADGSAKDEYDNLKERGYYSSLISANISQEVSVDSITLKLDQYPYFFNCYASQKLIRSSSTTTRKLITSGYLRSVGRSDNNPHGFLIERFEIITNKDTVTRN